MLASRERPGGGQAVQSSGRLAQSARALEKALSFANENATLLRMVVRWMTLVAVTGAACGASDGNRDPYSPTGDMGSADVGGDGSEPECSGSDHPDDLAIDPDTHEPTGAAPTRVIAVGTRVVVCGDGFVTRVDPMELVLGPEVALSGPCSAMAAIDEGHVAIVSGSTVSVRSTGSDTLPETSSAPLSAVGQGVASDGQRVFVALGSAGIAAFETADGSLLPGPTWPSPDARDVAWADGGLLVAEGATGVRLLSDDGTTAASIATASPAEGIRAAGARAAILRGGFGWDLLDVSADAIDLVASLETSGVVLDAAVLDDGVITAEAHALVRFDAEGEIVSSESRPGARDLQAGWLRGAAIVGEHGVVTDDDGVWPLVLGAPMARPRVELDIAAVAMWTAGEEPAEALLIVRNAGDAPMLLRGIEADAPLQAMADADGLETAPGCPEQLVVPAGASVPVELSLQHPSGEPWSGTLRLRTDDPDATLVEVPVDGNRPAPSLASLVEDFSLPTLDGGTFRLSDHRGKLVFLKLFNFACSTCAEEFPLIEEQLRPDYDPADVVMVGINTGHRTAYAADLAAEADLGMPFALDLDSEVFRRLRIPGKVFPLHVLVDREGQIAWVSNEKGIEPVRAAIEAAR